MKHNLYVCHTVYHLLITMARLNSDEKNSVCLVDTVPNFKSLKEKLRKTKLFETIYFLKAKDFVLGENYPDNFRKLYTNFFNSFDDVYIFNDDTYIGFYLFRQKIKYHLIEDGYNYFSYFLKPDNEKMNLKYLKDTGEGTVFPLVRGYNEMCIDIEVNDKSFLPKDERFSKFKEVPRDKLLGNLSDERKKEILKVFPTEECSPMQKSALILGQPLFIDGYMKSEKEQSEFYQSVIDDLSKDYDVYFKPHPRDTADISKFENVKIIPKSTPVEILQMNKGFKFDIGVTHSSTSLEFLSCVKEKKVLFNE